MKKVLVTAVLGAAIAAPASFAQQQSAPNQYQGVSQPPANDQIVTTDDAPPQPVVKHAAKPSAAIPASPVLPARNAPPVVPAKITNPDADMIQSVNPPAQQYEPASSAGFAKRPSDPDADMISVIPSPNNQLPEGTNINARLIDSLSTKETANGSLFRAQVTSNVYKNGRVIIPAGSELRGRVVQVEQGHHFGPAATLRLRPESVILPDGSAYHLYAQVISSGAQNTRVGSEGGIQPGTHYRKDAVEYGAGAGTGALLGAKIAGPTGALVGTAVGAGLITVHLLKQQPGVVDVPQGSRLVFSLTEPMDLTVTKN
ncbi:hypothetical protein [Acidipila rosea]|uniref:Uncharacterized protein n=1 Tax=Acidipila rosea TaxID=768535 RepID=A0A4R1LBZ8_9BACT|nr:hypothetical protein [Acidipila rosea]TCK75694.1 hypothetical protein C7378_0685 [Acidipila rosea]